MSTEHMSGGTVGLIVHLDNPALTDMRALGQAAEEAGADWIGVPDAFWWRDSWVLAAELARVTERLEIGPLVTNAYTRHPFVTVAAIATIQELAGPRVVVGLGAGGSEVGGAARLSRADAPDRVTELASLIRRVAAGEPLDSESGRALEVPLTAPRIIVGGRGPRMLAAVGRTADEALLWAVPRSELERTVGLVTTGTAARSPDLAPVGLIWAPLVEHDAASGALLRRAATYAVLNNRAEARERWGVSPDLRDRIRRLLIAGDTATAEKIVPDAVADDLATTAEVGTAAALARSVGASGLALPVTSAAAIADLVAWGRRVLAAIGD